MLVWSGCWSAARYRKARSAYLAFSIARELRTPKIGNRRKLGRLTIGPQDTILPHNQIEPTTRLRAAKLAG
jgi:hypothetical protein